MNTFSKKKISLIIVNFFALILVFYFSFNIYPSLNYDTKVDYEKIETNSEIFFSSVWIAKRSSADRQSYIEFKKNEFLTNFIAYLNSKEDIKKKAPCPNGLVKNNLRDIQIYPSYLGDPVVKTYEFNVRFNLSKFNLYNQDLSQLDQCFRYFFVENINKFFILYRKNLIDELKIEYDYKSSMGYNYPDNFTPTQLVKVNEFLNTVNFFVNPKANYSHSQNFRKNLGLNEIFVFLICLLILWIINISFYKSGYKKLSKIINKFINS
jgi:hypothetical protein